MFKSCKSKGDRATCLKIHNFNSFQKRKFGILAPEIRRKEPSENLLNQSEFESNTATITAILPHHHPQPLHHTRSHHKMIKTFTWGSRAKRNCHLLLPHACYILISFAHTHTGKNNSTNFKIGMCIICVCVCVRTAHTHAHTSTYVPNRYK